MDLYALPPRSDPKIAAKRKLKNKTSILKNEENKAEIANTRAKGNIRFFTSLKLKKFNKNSVKGFCDICSGFVKIVKNGITEPIVNNSEIEAKSIKKTNIDNCFLRFFDKTFQSLGIKNLILRIINCIFYPF